MANKPALLVAMLALVASAMTLAGGTEHTSPASAATPGALATRHHVNHTGQPAAATTAIEAAAAPSAMLEPPPGGWPVPTRRSYYLTSSCQPYASVIRAGAAAWQGLTEGGGTPVECRNTYIYDCGSGRIVGCNWGQGQRIALFIGGVGDGALLAAHEFGHDWYGHSGYQCAGWASPAQVMAPTICTLSASAHPARL